MTATDPYAPLTCPMPDCTEALFLDWTASRDLAYGDLTDEPPQVGDDSASTWQVKCGEGHVVLLPGRTGCPCDDQQGPGCPHQGAAERDFDWSEDSRTFRPGDVARLQSLLTNAA